MRPESDFVHIIRTAVGIGDVEHLIRVHARRAQDGPEGPFVITTTRFTPKRAGEILAGGSLFWIIKRYIRVRQRILDIRPFEDEEGRSRCALVLEFKHARTIPQRRRPHQGWRYFPPRDAPPDLGQLDAGKIAGVSPEMAAALRDLALI